MSANNRQWPTSREGQQGFAKRTLDPGWPVSARAFVRRDDRLDFIAKSLAGASDPFLGSRRNDTKRKGTCCQMI